MEKLNFIIAIDCPYCNYLPSMLGFKSPGNSGILVSSNDVKPKPKTKVVKD